MRRAGKLPKHMIAAPMHLTVAVFPVLVNHIPAPSTGTQMNATDTNASTVNTLHSQAACQSYTN